MTAPFSVNPENVPPAFDSERADRFIEDFAAEARVLLDDPGRRALLRSVAGNSPYLARSMLKEGAFLRELFDKGVDGVSTTSRPKRRGSRTKRISRSPCSDCVLRSAVQRSRSRWRTSPVSIRSSG
jgi:hypothetical protein